MEKEHGGFNIGDVIYSVCSDWEHANPMTIIRFEEYGSFAWQFEIVCLGSDGKEYSEIDSCWDKEEN